jgi:2-aminoadipate transaminase
MARYGIEVTGENVLITTGSQQGLDLIGKLLLNPADRVALEDPSYMGAIQAFTSYQARYLTVRMDDDGMRMDLLEEALRAAPKFVYVLPNFQNPSGVTLSLARRQRLVELAAHYGTPIVEDDPYGQLRYEGEHLPPLVKLDAELHGCANGERSFRGDVIYLGTLSKTLAPGLRVGWIVAPAQVAARLVQMKQGADLHSSTFTQIGRLRARGGLPLPRRGRQHLPPEFLLLSARGHRGGRAAPGPGAEGHPPGPVKREGRCARRSSSSRARPARWARRSSPA